VHATGRDIHHAQVQVVHQLQASGGRGLPSRSVRQVWRVCCVPRFYHRVSPYEGGSPQGRGWLAANAVRTEAMHVRLSGVQGLIVGKPQLVMFR
jgi:hypothetical protein